MQDTLDSTRPARWVAPVLLLLAGACVALAWVLLALYLQRSCGWMAITAALGCAMALRLGAVRPGWGRMATAVLATLALIVLVNWTVAATQIGFAMGLGPLDSALKLGADYAWTLAGLANGRADLVWLGISLPTAAMLSR